MPGSPHAKGTHVSRDGPAALRGAAAYAASPTWPRREDFAGSVKRELDRSGDLRVPSVIGDGIQCDCGLDDVPDSALDIHAPLFGMMAVSQDTIDLGKHHLVDIARHEETGSLAWRQNSSGLQDRDDRPRDRLVALSLDDRCSDDLRRNALGLLGWREPDEIGEQQAKATKGAGVASGDCIGRTDCTAR
jgi:hypothetical protein